MESVLFVHYLLLVDILSQLQSHVRRHDYTSDNVLLRNFIAITTRHAVVMTRKLISQVQTPDGKISIAL